MGFYKRLLEDKIYNNTLKLKGFGNFLKRDLRKEADENNQRFINKIRKEFRNEKLLLMFVINFTFLDKKTGLDNMTFI